MDDELLKTLIKDCLVYVAKSDISSEAYTNFELAAFAVMDELKEGAEAHAVGQGTRLY